MENKSIIMFGLQLHPNRPATITGNHLLCANCVAHFAANRDIKQGGVAMIRLSNKDASKPAFRRQAFSTNELYENSFR